MTKTAAEEKKQVESTEDIEKVADPAVDATADAEDKPAEADDSHGEAAAPAEAGDLLAGIDEAWLTAKSTTKEMLIEKCRQLGLDDSGKKAALAARVRKLIKPAYSFPTKVLCPRCRLPNTKVVSTQGNVRYHVCQTPTCSRKSFPVMAEKAK